MAISFENLEIAIDVVDKFSEDLSRLARGLEEVAVLQGMVDENMTIDVEVNGIESAQAQIASLNATNMGASIPDGGTSRVADGGSPIDIVGDIPWAVEPDDEKRNWLNSLQEKADINNLGDFTPTHQKGTFGKFRERMSGLLPEVGENESLFQKLNLNMGHFYDILASLMPLLLNFVAAMPAAIGALMGLATAALASAAALGGIAGLGLMGLASQRGNGNIGEGFQDIIEELRESFKDSFLPLADQFTDLAEDGIEGLERLFDQVAQIGYRFRSLRDEARALGGYVMGFVTSAVRNIHALTEAFKGVFTVFGEWMSTTDIIGAFVDVTQQALPPLMGIIHSTLDMLPALMKLSMGFLNVTEHIFAFFGALWNVVDALGPLGIWLGSVIGVMLALTSAIAFSAKMWGIWSNVVGGTALKSMAASVLGLESLTLAQIKAAGAAQLLKRALVSLAGVFLLGGALTFLGDFVSGWLGAGSAIDEATSSLKDFESVRGGMDSFDSGGFSGVSRGAETQWVDNSKTEVNVSGGDGEETTKAVRRANFKNEKFAGM